MGKFKVNNESGVDTSPAERQFHLANIWRLKGKPELAVACYRRAIALKSDHWEAHKWLGSVLIDTGRFQEGLTCLERVLANCPADRQTLIYHQYVNQLLTCRFSAEATPEVWAEGQLADHPEGKLNLRDQILFSHHRSGWSFSLAALKPLHNSAGVIFDGCIERYFGWQHWRAWVNPPDVQQRMKEDGVFDSLATSQEKGIVPYSRPWVGVVHNPQGMPKWFEYQAAPQTIFAKSIWQESLPYCQGLFTFSEYTARWLRDKTGVPVSTLVHPTELRVPAFDFDRFLANPNKKIVQVGWWLRRLSSIYRLPIDMDNRLDYRKVRLLPVRQGHKWQQILIDKEREIFGFTIEPRYEENTKVVNRLSDADFDALLAENIVFLDLYDSNANNAIVECIARATPLLVNSLPAVVEHLGPDYPLYFDSLSEAAEKTLDTKLIYEAHLHLKNCQTRHKLHPEYFLNSVTESEVYQQL